jgi:glucose/arabinose dehydrogenase
VAAPSASATAAAGAPSEAAPTKPPGRGGQSSTATPALRDVRVALEQVGTFEEPIAMAVRAGGAIYVAERAGRIVDLTQQTAPLLDISEQISTGGERGLLGFTFSKAGDEVYVSYTNVDGNSRVDAYPVRGDRAEVGRRRELLAVDQPYANHNGGNLLLGDDGMLYLGLGDGGSGGDPQRTAQDPSTLLGKMVRIDPRDGSAPPDNPFVGRDGYRPEIYASGLRNPWRFSFDRKTGDLWVADVGQDSIEEVNVTPARQSAGRNYGWSLFEGSQPFNGSQEPKGVVRPIIEYPTADGCAVTGGYVYRGDAIPALRGAYLYSDYCAGWIRAVRVRGGQVVDSADLGISAEGIASFGEAGNGDLYVLSLEGSVFKVVPG